MSFDFEYLRLLQYVSFMVLRWGTRDTLQSQIMIPLSLL